MILRYAFRTLLRFAFNLFYNPFAFTYDTISALVSNGHWREWTRAAIPHVAGTRVLEIPCGTGNLLLDLCNAGYHPIGIDLSSAMLSITRGKLRRAGAHDRAPLLRTRAQSLPLASRSFDSIIMTFPPPFVFDPQALAEFHRLLDANGRLIWVDGGRLLPRGWWSRALNAALDATSGEGNFEQVAQEVLSRAGFEARTESVSSEASIVSVIIAKKRNE